MDQGKLPHLRPINKQQQQSTIMNGKSMKAVHAELASNLPSNLHSFNNANTNGSAWSEIRSGSVPCNIRGPSAVKSSPTAWNEYAGRASSSKPSIVRPVRQQPGPKSSLDEYVSAQMVHQDNSPPNLRGKSTAATQAPKPTPPMNAGTVIKSAKQDSKVPCTYENCTRGFTKETDMKRHKDEDHEWCRLCDVDCADDEALLMHKIESDMHICCAICGEDFRSDMGRDRHVKQVSSWSWFQSVWIIG